MQPLRAQQTRRMLEQDTPLHLLDQCEPFLDHAASQILLDAQVPPMSAEQTRRVLQQNMPLPLDRIFERINLEQPLGSATISQVCLERFLLQNAALPTFHRHVSRSDDSLSVTPDIQIEE